MSIINDRSNCFIRPFVHGNYSRYFKKGARESDKHTHQWTVYLRPYYENDPIFSKHFIKKVVFQLHDSYPNKNRIFTNGPPYEVTETGWGEFEVIIRIFWKDCGERLVIHHPLKLYTETNSENQDVISGLKPFRVEHYNEIVFSNPSNSMYKHIISKLPKIPRQLVGRDPKPLEYFKKGAFDDFWEKCSDDGEEIDNLVEEPIIQSQIEPVEKSQQKNKRTEIKETTDIEVQEISKNAITEDSTRIYSDKQSKKSKKSVVEVQDISSQESDDIIIIGDTNSGKPEKKNNKDKQETIIKKQVKKPVNLSDLGQSTSKNEKQSHSNTSRPPSRTKTRSVTPTVNIFEKDAADRENSNTPRESRSMRKRAIEQEQKHSKDSKKLKKDKKSSETKSSESGSSRGTRSSRRTDRNLNSSEKMKEKEREKEKEIEIEKDKEKDKVSIDKKVKEPTLKKDQQKQINPDNLKTTNKEPKKIEKTPPSVKKEASALTVKTEASTENIVNHKSSNIDDRKIAKKETVQNIKIEKKNEDKISEKISGIPSNTTVSLKNLKKASSSSANHSENHTNHGPFQNSLSKSEISLPLDPDLVRHLPFGNLRVQEEIALVSNVPLTQPRSDLAHNYHVLEEEQLQRISSANDRIMNQIVYYEELRRMKLHFLEVLLQQ